MHRIPRLSDRGSVSFSLRQETFAVAGSGQRYVPLLVAGLLVKKLGGWVVLVALGPVAFHYVPTLAALFAGVAR